MQPHVPSLDGIEEGWVDGIVDTEGIQEGIIDGRTLGALEGLDDGTMEGWLEGLAVGQSAPMIRPHPPGTNTT